MKVQPTLLAAVAILALSFAWVANTSATVLIFNNAAGGLVTTQGNTIPQTYGDNVISTNQGGFSYGIGAEGFTPGVTVAWGTAAGFSSDPIAWATGYGDLTNVAYGQFPGIRLKLTGADTNQLVKLYSFDLGSWASVDRSNIIITISNEFGIVYQNLNATVTGATHSTFAFSSSPLMGQLIDIHINLNNGGHNGLVAIDNIVFGQIPEPSSLSFLGVAGLLLWRRMKQTK